MKTRFVKYLSGVLCLLILLGVYILPGFSGLANAASSVNTPTFAPTGGTYTTSQNVTITCGTSGAAIRYTTDGTTPTSSSTLYNGPITVSNTTTIKAIGIKTGLSNSSVASATYTMKISTPVFTPTAGTYSTSQTVTISCATSGATIKYTTDGSTPTSNSPTYTAPIVVSSNKTIKAYASKTGMTNSDVASASYVITPKISTPTFTPTADTYSTSQTVTISCTTSGATIKYTTDGSTPTSNSPTYTAPIVVSSNVTIKAYASKAGMTDSDVASASYFIAPKVLTPTFTPSAGTYSTSQTVTVNCATEGANIFYTTDGSTPTTNSTAYSGPVIVSSTKTIKAFATKTGMTNSSIASATYTIKVSTPTFSISSGSYASPQALVLTCATSGAAIRYTTDGSTPTAASSLYTNPITISQNTTIKAIGILAGLSNSNVASANYSIRVATPVFNPTSSMYTQPITITCETEGATIKYTTDGTLPTESSQTYNGPITLTTDTQLMAYAFKTGMDDSMKASTYFTIAPQFGFTQIAAGGKHSIALKADGTVWYWGTDQNVQYVNNSSSVPIKVNGLNNIIAIAANGDNNLAVKNDGTLWNWGGSRSLTQINLGTGKVTAVAAGATHCLALKEDGSVWAWGDNYFGQLGNGTNTSGNTPVQVTGLGNVKEIACGTSHSVALTEEGYIYAWGHNLLSQLGNGSYNNSNVPILVPGISNVMRIASGKYDTLAIDQSGQVWAWGYYTTQNPKQINADGLNGAKRISAGDNSFYIVDIDGCIWSWGLNSKGEIGNGTTTRYYTPQKIENTRGIQEISAGLNFAIALKADGGILAWGKDDKGQLGDGTWNGYSFPRYLSGFNDIKEISSGYWNTIFLLQDEYIYDYESGPSPNLKKKSGIDSIKTVSTGWGYCIALKNDGTVYAWGNNGVGQLGNGTNNSVSGVVQVMGLNNILEISSGDSHNLALDADGYVWAWGRNNCGQLGIGTNTDSYYPAKVKNPENANYLNDVKHIYASNNMSIIEKNDGTFWAWGDNRYGQLGDGTDTNRNLPVQIIGLDNVKEVIPGGWNSYALKNDGTVLAWGNNWYGQLGNGTNTTSYTPVQVIGIDNVQKIKCGKIWEENRYYNFAIALKNDGTVWSWGQNEFGELGNGSYRDKNMPAQVLDLKEIKEIETGYGNIFAVKEGGGIWTFGRDENYSIASPVRTTELNDANLRNISVDNKVINNFREDGMSYEVTLPAGSTLAPVVNAFPYNPNATVSISQAGSTTETAEIEVSSPYGLNKKTYTVAFSVATGDTQAPTAPTNLVSTSKTDTTVDLSWTASTDNIGVIGYDVYNGETKVGSPKETTYTVTGLTANTEYSFTVQAKDAAGNVSASSAALSVTTAVYDAEAPTAPTNLISLSITDTTVDLSWTASTDNMGVVGYDVYSGTTVVGSPAGTIYTVTGLTANTEYSFTVKAKDAAGNVSASSAALSVTTAVYDSEVPSTPTGLTATNITDSSVTLTWNPSTGDAEIKEYDIFNHGIFIGTTDLTTYTVMGLAPNEKCEFAVYAIDTANNASKDGAYCSVTTTVSSMEQLKTALIKNFYVKGTTCSLTYTGDTTDLDNNINNAILNAVYETVTPFMLQNYSYTYNGNQGNITVEFAFVYGSKEYSHISYSFDDFKENIISGLNNRDKNISIVFKGEITSAEVSKILDDILKNDSYLRFCISNSSQSMSSYMGSNGIIINVEFETTKEQEDYVDKNVEFIAANITNSYMNDDEKEKMIHDYLLSRLKYSPEASFGNAYSALYYGETSCEGYAMLTYKMLKAAGIDNIIVTNTDHAWNVVKINNKWYHLDTTWDDGEKRDEGVYEYYNLTDDEILETHAYTNTSGILCTSNYVEDLKTLNTNSSGKFEKILKDIKRKTDYSTINVFKSNASMNLLYSDVILKEGEQISLISNEFPTGFYDDTYAWRSSDPDIADVSNGLIIAKKAGKVTISAVKTYLSILDNNLIATITVVPKNSQDGKTPQPLAQNNIIGFTDPNVVPQLTINSSEDVNTTTTATNCFNLLNGKVGLIGQPIDIKTTSKFDWADISFKLSPEQLSKVNINNLTIYWYDLETGTIVPQPTKVNSETGTVSATVTHFSIYFLSLRVLQENTLDIAFMIDSQYGSQNSLNTFKTNITNTLLELRKNTNVRIVFVDNNNSNSDQVQNLYFFKVENPTTNTNNEVINGVKAVFDNITALGKIPTESEYKKICTDALTKARTVIKNKNMILRLFGVYPQETYALVYTQWDGYFEDSQWILLDMGDSIGLVVGNTIGYYEDEPIAYNESNILPLVKFLLQGDYSLLTMEKNGKRSWLLKEGLNNNVDDVTVLQKVLIINGYLDMPKDLSGNRVPFGIYDTATKNAVINYQAKTGFVINGVVEKNIWKKLALPWDDTNGIPLRSSYDYLTILNTNFYMENPSVSLTFPTNGSKFEAGQTITITATGVSCDHIALFINNKFVVTQSGNSFRYDYIIKTTDTYSIQVKARNVPGSYGGDLVVSGIANITGIGNQKVEEAQRLLKELGYNLGTYGPNHDGIDGIWTSGGKTQVALISFRNDRQSEYNGHYKYSDYTWMGAHEDYNNLNTEGKVDDQMLRALNQYVNEWNLNNVTSIPKIVLFKAGFPTKYIILDNSGINEIIALESQGWSPVSATGGTPIVLHKDGKSIKVLVNVKDYLISKGWSIQGMGYPDDPEPTKSEIDLLLLKSINGDYYNEYLALTPDSVHPSIMYGIDPLYEYHWYLFEAKKLGLTVDETITFEQFVNAMGPVWEQAFNSKSQIDRMSEAAMIAVTAVALGYMFVEGYVLCETVLLPMFQRYSPTFANILSQRLASANNVNITPKFYRKMSIVEANKTIDSKNMQPAIQGTNSAKYITQSLEKARAFSNNGIPSGTQQVIVEFEMDSEYYKSVLQNSVYQYNSKGIDAIKYNFEGLQGTELRNFGVPSTQLEAFNRYIRGVRVIE